MLSGMPVMRSWSDSEAVVRMLSEHKAVRSPRGAALVQRERKRVQEERERTIRNARLAKEMPALFAA